MRVLFAAYEIFPFAKVGGLADVAGALPKFLDKSDLDIELVMPYHTGIKGEGIRTAGFQVSTTFVEKGYTFDVFEGELPDSKVRVYFLKNEELMDSPDVYGGKNLGLQAMAFCDAVVSLSKRSSYDIVHMNDWQTALVAPYLKAVNDDSPATLFTIHNLGYQGDFSPDYFYMSGLPESFFTYEGVLHYGKFNFLKAGLIYSDILNTVSKAYADEIQTEEYGAGLQEVLKLRSDSFYGVLNGIDYDIYDPSKDPRLPASFSSDAPEGKAQCKKQLQEELGLEPSDAPVIALISRLVHQKGLDILSDITEKIVELGAQLIILGTGDSHFEEFFKNASFRFPGSVSANILFDAGLAQRIYGGSDMFLMPSLYEPCGLGQMFSMRYGTVPVVRYTGGLKDTVTEFNENTKKGNGFGFTDYNGKALLEAISRAMSTYCRKEYWEMIVKNAMTTDCSWNRSASEYIELYKLSVKKRKEKANNA